MSRRSADSTIEVYAPQFKSVYTLPSSDVYHLPPAELHVTRLVLCERWAPPTIVELTVNPKHPGTGCALGDRCKFVHAVTHNAVAEKEVHINYAWRTVDSVTYERFAAGQTVRVAAPNGRTTVDVIPSERLLRTRVFDESDAKRGRRPPSHCAHFYFNRACNLGPECRFVHAVYVDPNAAPFQRAPVPADIGRTEPSKRQQQRQRQTTRPAPAAAPEPVEAAATAPPAVEHEVPLAGVLDAPAYLPTPAVRPRTRKVERVSVAPLRAAPATSYGDMDALAWARPESHEYDPCCAECAKAAEKSAALAGRSQYRHNPYAAAPSWAPDCPATGF